MRIPKEYKLIIGETYYILEGSNIWIGKYLYDHNESEENKFRGIFTFLQYNTKLIFNENNKYQFSFDKKEVLCFYIIDNNNNNMIRTYRVATYKEKRWLECCIENDRYIPEKEFNIMFRKEKILKLLFQSTEGGK